jgi:hypothetical protein
MARRLTLGTYQRRASRATADTATLYEGGRQLGKKAWAEGKGWDDNPFAAGAKTSLRQGGDRFRIAALGWNAGMEEAAGIGDDHSHRFDLPGIDY